MKACMWCKLDGIEQCPTHRVWGKARDFAVLFGVIVAGDLVAVGLVFLALRAVS